MWECDGAVWVLHIHRVFETQRDFLLQSGVDGSESLLIPSDERVFSVSLDMKFDRAVAQQGSFTVSSHVRTDHAEILRKRDGALEKLVVPASLKAQFLKQLQLLNITGSALFPGLDGWGRTVDDLVRLQASACAGIHKANADDNQSTTARDST